MYFKVVKHPFKLLKNPELFRSFYIVQSYKILRFKLTGKKKQSGRIGNRKIADSLQANNMIFEGLVADKPFMIGRIGGIETEFVVKNIFEKIGAIDGLSEKEMQGGKDHAGIFPAEKTVFERFAKIYSDAMTELDISVYWGHILCEEYVQKKYAPDAKLIPSRPLEPFGFERPWTMALKGKKVLVVHPLKELIEKQYAKREKLFATDVLPEFELKTIKAVQSLADEDCGFDSWVDALEDMKKQIDGMEFDIAMLGCGAYAMPLAAHIKKSGKKAIVLGGMTQLLFGIKGARWEKSRPDIVAMYNEHWTRPGKTDVPAGGNRTEDGAYW